MEPRWLLHIQRADDTSITNSFKTQVLARAVFEDYVLQTPELVTGGALMFFDGETVQVIEKFERKGGES